MRGDDGPVLFAAWFLQLLLVQQSSPSDQDPGDQALARHVEALGGEGALAGAGDLLIEGTIDHAPYRVLVRRRPFGVREELRPPGAPPRVFVSDGEYAWELLPS